MAKLDPHQQTLILDARQAFHHEGRVQVQSDRHNREAFDTAPFALAKARELFQELDKSKAASQTFMPKDMHWLVQKAEEIFQQYPEKGFWNLFLDSSFLTQDQLHAIEEIRFGASIQRQRLQTVLANGKTKYESSSSNLPTPTGKQPEFEILEDAPNKAALLALASNPDFSPTHNSRVTTVHAILIDGNQVRGLIGVKPNVSYESLDDSTERLTAEQVKALRSAISAFDEVPGLGSGHGKLGQLQYTLWLVPYFLTKAQLEWLREHEPQLWIELHATKIGWSSSIIDFLKKMQAIQSYIPFAAVHFRARFCKNGYNREQCKHFIWHHRHLNGERLQPLANVCST